MLTPNTTTSTCWKDLREHHPACPACKYDLGGLPEPVCPECGLGWSVEQITGHAALPRGAHFEAAIAPMMPIFTLSLFTTTVVMGGFAIVSWQRAAEASLLAALCCLLSWPRDAAAILTVRRTTPRPESDAVLFRIALAIVLGMLVSAALCRAF